MRCPSCGGVSHPATGSVLPSGEVVCGPCVRRFWSWASEHGKKTYRVGKKGKGSKYIAFPTGITKKNSAERDCIKCGGSGRIPQFGHYAEGVCFDCGGTGKKRWQEHAQLFLDELRKLGAGAKADEIAQQFQSRLRVPVKNSRRRTSRRRTSRR